MPKGLKVTLISFLALLFSACIFIDVWYLILRSRNPDTFVSNTFEVGLQTLKDGTTKHFAEVQVYRNEDNSGLAAFEVKFNYLLDETETAFYSQGLQYVADSIDKIAWTYYSDVEIYKDLDEPDILSNYFHHYHMGYLKPTSNTSFYNYQSSDDYKTTTISSNPINNNSTFKIQLQNDGIYAMRFKSNEQNNIKEVPFENKESLENYLSSTSSPHYGTYKGDYDFKVLYTNFHYHHYYTYLDFNYFSQLLFNSTKSLKSGTQQSVVFEFGDIFNYYDYLEDEGKYASNKIKDSSLISTETKNYYSIQVTINSGGLKKASDSLFNAANGSMNYNNSEDILDSGYFIGRTITNVSFDDFVFIETSDDKKYKLKLDSLFLSKYYQYRDVIFLDVVINLDEFNDLGVEFDGFVDGCFDGFVVRTCNTVETVDGEIITTGVKL